MVSLRGLILVKSTVLDVVGEGGLRDVVLRVVGVGEPVVEPHLFMSMARDGVEKPVVRNIYDLSLFLKLFK